MPKSSHGAGLVSAALLLAGGVTGCSGLPQLQPAPVITPAPLPSATPAYNWRESLAISGDITTTIIGAAPDQTGQHSACTGPESRVQKVWALTLYFTLSRQTWGLVLSVPNDYQGPGTYATNQVTVQLFNSDKSQVWENQPADTVSLVIGADEESGTIDAVATNLNDLKGQVHVTGSWTCQI